MPVFNLFSKIRARERGQVTDVYQYQDMPQTLKNQIFQIVCDILGNPHEEYDAEGRIKNVYTLITKTLRREYGLLHLSGDNRNDNGNTFAELFNFFLSQKDIEKCIDVIDVCVAAINQHGRDYHHRYINDANARADEAISEINYRFREAGVGYEYVDGNFVRIDSELIHAETVKPALQFLNKSIYAGARQEYLNAHSHYREKRYKEAITDCHKSFESTMKAICTKRRWPFDQAKATAKDLISICFEKGLVPQFWSNSFNQLKSLLESSVPTARNKTSAHGQGIVPTEIDEAVVQYIMHMTASTIVFLCKSEEDLS